ncbi:MAG TPA: 5'-nucleotidase C-terminal domain-containing protein [Clostridia bacterium]|nr:5'-nucleotidase C-terminal domain-containing protein [Clostridia bacterium]
MKQVSKRLSILLTLIMILSMVLPMGNVLAEVAIDGIGPSVGSKATVTILGSTDLHGRIYPWEYATDTQDIDAGMAKIQTLVKQEKAANLNTILIDIGDTLQDNMADIFNNNDVHPMMQGLNYMGYDTWTLGNHEFNFGLDFLNKNISAFKGKVLAANIYKADGTRFVEPYAIFEKAGVRIAVVGLITPHIPRWEASTPEHFKDLTFKDPVEEAKKVVKELEGKYDVLVGSVHMGDTAEYGNTDGAIPIAEACPEFDVIFCGHKHAKFDNITSTNGVKLIEAGNYGWALAKADINVAYTASGWTVEDVATKNLPTDKVAADEEMLAEFKWVHDTAQTEANKVVGEITADFVNGVDYLTGGDKVTTLATAQVQDTAVVDLINTVQKHYAKAEISSAALFRNDSNLKKGDFKKKDVANIYMYENTLMGVNISGKNLKAYMEWSANYYNTYKEGDLAPGFNADIRGYNYDMFSGVNYEIDITKPAGSRIVNLTFNGSPIDDNKIYKLALNNYRFGTLLSLELIKNEDKYYDSFAEYGDAGRVRDLIVKYVQENLKGKLVPAVDNNWNIIGANYENPLKDEILAKVKEGKISIPTSMDGRTLNVRALNVDDVAKLGEVEGTSVISLITVNDFHGAMTGDAKNPGISKLVAYLKNEEKANKNGTLILSAGDMFQGTADSNLLYGKSVVTAMNEAGFDAMVLGNHEFDWGLDKLKARIAESDFPYLGANLIDKATGKTADFIRPYTIVEKNGIKVGIIGIVTPETATKTKPEMVAPFEFRNPAEVVNALVPEVKAAGADVIVVLSHLGALQDSKTGAITGEAADLAKAVTGVDAIIAGHTHANVSGFVNNIPVVANNYNGRSIGHIDIFMDAAAKTVSKRVPYLDGSAVKAMEDSRVTGWYAYIQKTIAPIKNEVLGNATADFPHSPKDTQTTLLGNWATDIMRKEVNADIAIQNGGGLRRDLPAGVVTMGLLYEIMPFDNTLFTMDLTGAQVKAAIEHGIMSADFNPGQFSGLMVKYDSTKPAGERIVEIKLADGTALEDDKLYKVVTNDFQADGGDKYTMFKDGQNRYNTNIPVRDVLVNEIKAKGTISPVDDGRLIDVNKTSMLMYQIAA